MATDMFGFFPDLGTMLRMVLGVLVVGGLIGWIVYNRLFQYRALIYQETAGGGGYFIWSKARVFFKDGVKQMQVMKFRNEILPPPTLDTMTNMKGGKPVVQLWRDVNTNIHPVRWTRNVPVLVEDGDELKQLEEEVKDLSLESGKSVEDVKKKGFFSGVLNMFVREAKVVKDNPGGYKKKIVGVEETLFEPDNRSMRMAVARALLRNYEKHKNIPWWKESWFLGITGLAIVTVLFIVSGYFLTEMWKAQITESRVAVEASAQANKYLKDALLMIGKNPMIIPQTGNVVGNVTGGGG